MDIVESAAGTAARSGITVSHVGLCVADYERSLRFYTEGLGFEIAEGWALGSDFAALAEITEPMQARAQILVKGATRLEIIAWTTPAAVGTPPRTRNHIGLTHLSFYVEDMATVEAHLVSLGATVLEDTRMHIEVPRGTLDMVFLADPDGTRIELVRDTTGS